MKKRLLMPILMASVMMASVFCLESCNKKSENTEPKTFYRYIEDEEMPIVEEYQIGREIDYTHWRTCPYCSTPENPVLIYANDTTHWHTFGYDYKHNVAGQFEVDECMLAYGPDDMACPYSGVAYDLTHDEGDRPRFHGHRVFCIRNMPGYDGGMYNKWHVGGGIGEPTPLPTPPTPPTNP